MSDLSSRLLSIRKTMGLTQVEMSKKIGIVQGLYSRYETGRLELPDDLKSVLYRFGVDINWLLTGTGDMFISSIPSIGSIPSIPLVRMDIVGSIAAGTPREITNSEPLGYIDLDARFVTRNSYVFRVEGDSMYPEIKNNDLILIRQVDVDSIQQGAVVAVQIYGENTLKSYYTDAHNKQTILNPYNHQHSPIILNRHTPGNPTVLGIMVQLIRNYI